MVTLPNCHGVNYTACAILGKWYNGKVQCYVGLNCYLQLFHLLLSALNLSGVYHTVL